MASYAKNIISAMAWRDAATQGVDLMETGMRAAGVEADVIAATKAGAIAAVDAHYRDLADRVARPVEVGGEGEAIAYEDFGPEPEGDL